MKGNLYIVTNTINNKVYIGKTYKTLQRRWLDHLSSSLQLNDDNSGYRYNYKFYNALRKYGSDKFTIKLIGQFEEGELEQKEIEYINKYDSYYNGYNSTLGGDGYKRELKMESYAEEILKLYEQGFGCGYIAEIYNTSINSIHNVLVKFGVQLRQDTYREDTRVVMYDKYFNPIRIFKTKLEIADWLINETDYVYYQRTLYTAINNSCKYGCIRYGHRWQLYSDLKCEDKFFRTKFDKETYLDGGNAYQPDGKTYWVVDGSIDSIVNIKKNTEKIVAHKENKSYMCINCGKAINHKGKYCEDCRKEINRQRSREYGKTHTRMEKRTDICSMCGKPITSRTSTGMCRSCANVVAKGKSAKPSREELKELLDRNVPIPEIAYTYNRTESTVYYWIRQYNLK